MRSRAAEGATGRTAADKEWLADQYGAAGVAQGLLDRITYGLIDALIPLAPPPALSRSVAASETTPILLIAAGDVADEGFVAERLRAVGLRVTQSRLAVLDVVHSDPHLSADQVAERVRSGIGAVSTQAIYDALNTLTEHHILRRFEPAGSAMKFEVATGDNHHHLVCRSCGAIEDVDCATGEAPCLEPAHAHGFVEIEQRDAVGRCEARVDPLDAMTVRIGLDHGPHARLRGGAADEVEVVADGVRSDVGDDGTGHGDVSDRMSFGARGGAGSAAWRDNAPGQC